MKAAALITLLYAGILIFALACSAFAWAAIVAVAYHFAVWLGWI